MNHKNQGALRQFLNIRGMRGAMTAFAGLIVIYIAFGALYFQDKMLQTCSVPCQST